MNQHSNRRTQLLEAIAASATVVMGLACAPDLPLPDPESYRSDFSAWHESRIEGLKDPDGWFSVVGLFWLEAGPSTFGSDASNTLEFPAPAPPRIGVFERSGMTVEMHVDPGVRVTHDGLPVTSLVLSPSESGPTVTVQLESLSWFVIRRADRIGIRLKDSANPAIADFDGIEMFPLSMDWLLPARFDRYDPPQMIRVPNVIGTVALQPSPGAVVFRIGDEQFRLDTTGNPDDEYYFIVFGDSTNVESTYGGGRFLSVKAPDERGRMFIDFNRATNPPCAFTAFATCPLPPRQNHLTARIEAGEKRWH